MRIVTHTIWISRPREDVFDFFVDFSKAPCWRQYVRTMERLDEGPLRAGSRVHVTMELMGEPYVFDLDVLMYERPSRWRHRSNETDYRGFVEYRFEPEQAGTRVTMTIEARPVGLYGWLGLPLILLGRGRNKPYAEQLPQLKRAVEAS
jgi:uncharacterized membrane protein